jgi:pimeloyl-ACP methyl ester carboxylesterase
MRQLFYLLGLILSMTKLHGQAISYGNNEQAAHYLKADDSTRLYYEIYGEGPPLVMLHGDFYGYIDEFADYIPLLSRYYKVIAPAKRGHGKSEMGKSVFNDERYAKDVLAILKQEGVDSTSVLGFSSGGNTALYLAAYYPQHIKKVVAMAAGIKSRFYKPAAVTEMKELNYPAMKKKALKFFLSREALMPQPERFGELLEKLKQVWLAETFMSETKVRSIKSKVLIAGGDNDEYYRVENFTYLFNIINGAKLAIIPSCTHVGLLERPAIINDYVLPFLNNGKTD